MENTRRRFSIRGPQPSILEATLADKSFSAAGYVDSVLAHATVSEFAEYYSSLNQQQAQNEADLKKAIQSSVSQVLSVATAVQLSKSVLKDMKPSIDSLTQLIDLQLDNAQLNVLKDTKTADRHSVLFLQSKWSSSLKDLYMRIDHLMDVLPNTNSSNRRIVYESKKWWEFNIISNKAIRPLHIVVLSDCIVIAARSKSKDGAQKSLASHCWPIDTLNILTGDQIPNLNKNQQSEDEYNVMLSTPDYSSFIIKTDKSLEYNSLVESLKSSKKEYLATKKHNKRRSWALSIDSKRMSLEAAKINNTDTSLESIKLIENKIEQIDDLLTSSSLAMSLRNYDSAVGFIKSLDEQLEKLLASTVKDLSQHISLVYDIKMEATSKLKEQLITKLSNELGNYIVSKDEKAKSLVELLSILGKNYLIKAQDDWLQQREKDLNHSVSTLRFGSNTTSIRKSSQRHTKRESIMLTPLTPTTNANSSTIITTENPNAGPVNAVAESDGNEAMAAQIILSYVREICLIYVGYCLRTWDEYKAVFQSQCPNTTKVVDWIISKMESLRNQIDNVLVDYEHDSAVWTQSLLILKLTLDKLKVQGLDVSFIIQSI